MLECVVNISEGARPEVVAELASITRDSLLDLHADRHHNRSVFTLIGEDAPRALARAAVAMIDIRDHSGVHPRIGVVDVVPFAPLGRSTLADAEEASERFGRWAGSRLGLPCFAYGPSRSLPDVRSGAFRLFGPDWGPPQPHPSAGAVAVGARPVLIAYNLWLDVDDLAVAHDIARKVRGPAVRALGFQVGGRVQVSTNLIDPSAVGPGEIYDLVRAEAPVARCELVGLLARDVLMRIGRDRWGQLDLGADRTIESRIEAMGLTLA